MLAGITGPIWEWKELRFRLLRHECEEIVYLEKYSIRNDFWKCSPQSLTLARMSSPKTDLRNQIIKHRLFDDPQFASTGKISSTELDLLIAHYEQSCRAVRDPQHRLPPSRACTRRPSHINQAENFLHRLLNDSVRRRSHLLLGVVRRSQSKFSHNFKGFPDGLYFIFSAERLYKAT